MFGGLDTVVVAFIEIALLLLSPAYDVRICENACDKKLYLDNRAPWLTFLSSGLLGLGVGDVELMPLSSMYFSTPFFC